MASSEPNVFPVAWYPACWAKDLRDQPLKRRIAGRDYVLWRDATGTPHALQAYCPHRGADLSLGRCGGDHLMCAYHGWQFTADGQCRHIPAHPDKPIPDFAHARTYPVQERLGLLWLYPEADVEPPVLQVFPELENPQLVLAPFDATWQAHLTRVVESVLDVAHLHFVHKKTIGKRTPAAVQNMQFAVKEDGNRIEIELGDALLVFQWPQQWMLLPNNGSPSFLQYLAFTPVEQEGTVLYGIAGRSFAKRVPGLTPFFSRFSAKVLEEDRAIVESQHPRPIPEALRLEVHVEADGPQVRYRNRWFQFLQGEPKLES